MNYAGNGKDLGQGKFSSRKTVDFLALNFPIKFAKSLTPTY